MAFLPSLWRFADRFIPREIRSDDDETERLRRMRLLVISIFGLLPLAALAAYRMSGTGADGLVLWVSLLPGPLLLGCLLLVRLAGNFRVAGTVFCGILVGYLLVISLVDQGISAPALVWAIPIPLFAAFIVGPRAMVSALTLLIVGVLGLYLAEIGGYYVPPSVTDSAYMMRGTVTGIITALIAVAAISWLYEGYTVRRLRSMNDELRHLRTELQQSEQQYKSLFDNIPTGVYRSKPDGQIVMANKALLDMLAVPSLDALDEIDASSLYVDPEGRKKLLEKLDAVEQLHGVEFDLRAADGRELTVRETAHTARDESGKAVFYEGIIEDISGQREAELTVRRVEERYRALVQHSTDIITLLDSDGIIRYQSPSISGNLGYEQGETVGTHVLNLVHPEDRPGIAVILRRALSRPEGMGTHCFRCRHKEGHYVYIESVGSNMLDNPAVGGFVVNSRDVTEHKRAEVALIRAKEQAEEVARLKSAFLANMSHEIRTPLTGIIGFAGVLAEEVTDQHREFVGLIERSGRRLLQTLNSVLDLARLEADQMEVELRKIDVVEHVQDIVQLLQPIAAENGIALKVSAPSQPAYSRLDMGCLSRILNNLVGNALKFTDEGEVRVSVEVDGEMLKIRVADTGIGIDEQFLPHLFEEFKQESTGLQRQHEGSGLGLTITRRLVELMQGTITVTSEKGKGSVFTVTLPVAEQPPVETAAMPTDPGNPRVLVVDDNQSTLALMKHIIGHVATVDIAHDQTIALGLIDDAEPGAYDLIFMDIHLGGSVSGSDVMRQIRTRRGYADTSIIAFTAFALPGDRERFLNAGFSGYLGKPFSRQEVVEMVQSITPAPRVDSNGELDSGVTIVQADWKAPLEATYISG